jgi:hypothetical protein
MKVIPVKQARLEWMARHPTPLKMGTHVSYNEIAAIVAELYEMRRKYGPLRVRELDLPVTGGCTGCREEIIDGVCRCFPPP